MALSPSNRTTRLEGNREPTPDGGRCRAGQLLFSFAELMEVMSGSVYEL
jgi:hypothetical protein